MTSTRMKTHPAQGVVVISPVANIINLVMIPVSLITVILVVANASGDARLWFSIALFVLGPGSGIVQFFRLPNGAMQLGVLIGLSAAIDLLLGEALLSIHNISGDAAVCLLAGITCIRPMRWHTEESNER